MINTQLPQLWIQYQKVSIIFKKLKIFVKENTKKQAHTLALTDLARYNLTGIKKSSFFQLRLGLNHVQTFFPGPDYMHI